MSYLHPRLPRGFPPRWHFPALLAALAFGGAGELPAQGSCEEQFGGAAFLAAVVPQAEGPPYVLLPWNDPVPGDDSSYRILTGPGQPLPTGVATARVVADGSSNKLLVDFDPTRTPLAGTKRIRFEDPNGRRCVDFRLSAALPTEARAKWQVDGLPRDYLDGSGMLTTANVLALVVEGPDLWQDTRLELDPRLASTLNLQPPQASAGDGGAVRIVHALGPPVSGGLLYELPGGRYAVRLRNSGWEANASGEAGLQIPPVEVRGGPPTFLRPPNGGDYEVAASAADIETVLRGKNLAGPLTISVQAVDRGGAELATATLPGKMPTPCEGADASGTDCVQISFARLVRNAAAHLVRATTFDGQTTPVAARIVPKPNAFAFASLEVRGQDPAFALAGRRANLLLAVPPDVAAAPGAAMPVLVDGQDVTATAYAVGVVGREQIRIDDLDVADITSDRADRRIEVRYPDNATYGYAILPVRRPPSLDDPVVIYGSNSPIIVRIPGRDLSEARLESGGIVTVQEATRDGDALRAKLAVRTRDTGTYRLRLKRGEAHVSDVEVQVLGRDPIGDLAVLTFADDSGACPDANAGKPLSEGGTMDASGSVCVRIRPASHASLSPDVEDAVIVTVTQDGTTLAESGRRTYSARRGTEEPILLRLRNVQDGVPLTVSVEREADGATDAGRVATRVAERLGLYASVTAVGFLFGSDHAEKLDEDPTAGVLAGNFGIWWKPKATDRHLQLFGGIQRLTRKFCGGASESGTFVPLLGVSYRVLSFGAGRALESDLPGGCDPGADGSPLPEVRDRGGWYVFVGLPTLKLLDIPLP